ncbi:MAG: enolase C-terminal domain-like protein [Acidobacteriota bacterium]|jgi:L-alanine-DL-glutamate epimerase-like enolase superfamily enzyme
MSRIDAPIERVAVSAYTIPTDEPEADGTLEWDATTIVVVEAQGGGRTGLGWSYTAPAAARLIEDTLAPVVVGRDAMAAPAAWQAMIRSIRNLGRPGLVSSAVAAVDTALWDLEARLLDVPLVELLGAAVERVPVYGSGGFTSYSMGRLREQLAGWVADGIPRVKMKVGSDPGRDPERVDAARDAIGDAELMVDANGAYDVEQALAMSSVFADRAVSWFEEPVSSDDLEGLRRVREDTPRGMNTTAGEYGYDIFYFRRMLEAGAVDVLQADATRCAGYTGYRDVAALCRAFNVPLSAHTAPALHLHVCAASPATLHMEWFHDHVRIERMLLDGFIEPRDGAVAPDLSQPGNGYVFLRGAASERQVYGARIDG